MGEHCRAENAQFGDQVKSPKKVDVAVLGCAVEDIGVVMWEFWGSGLRIWASLMLELWGGRLRMWGLLCGSFGAGG